MKKKLILLCVTFIAVLSIFVLSSVLTISAEEVTEYSITISDDSTDTIWIWKQETETSWSNVSAAPEGAAIRITSEDGYTFTGAGGYDGYILVGAYVNGDYVSAEKTDWGQREVFFAMPAGNVEIIPDFSKGYIVTCLETHGGIVYYDEGGEYFEGEDVSISLDTRSSFVDNNDRRIITGVVLDGETISFKNDQGVLPEHGYHSFTMPNHDVNIELVTEKAYKASLIGEVTENVYIFREYYDPDDDDCYYSGNTYEYLYSIEGSSLFLESDRDANFQIIKAYINGEEVDADEYGRIEFTMPAEDIEIELVTVPRYNITVIGDGAEDCGVRENAIEGETVSVGYFGDNNLGLVGILVNGEEVNEIDEHGRIEFTMPAEDVEIELILAEKFYIDIEDSLVHEGIYWWVDEHHLAPGQTVELHYELDAGIVGFTVNGEEVDFTIVEEDEYNITATFTMPAEDILIEALYDDTQYTITVDSDYGAAIHSSALVNEFVDLVFEHVPGYIISSITINGIDITEFNGDDRTDRFYMPAENVVIKITYEETDEEYEELTFEADIKLPSEGFGGDYETIVKLPENVSNAMPEELRNDPDFPAIIWLASDGAFPALTFESIEDFDTLYTMEYDGVFSEDYNHGAIIAVATDKNYAFARGTVIINGKEVPATLLTRDIGNDTYYGTYIFFEFELAEFAEEEVDLEITIENMPSVGETFYEYIEIDEWDGYYESKIDFELPIDGNYEIEEFIWLHTDSSFPEINNYEDFSELLGLMLDYDAVITSEGKYAVLMAVTVEYGTILNEGIAIINGQTVKVTLIYPEDLEATTMSNGNTVFVLIEFEVNDEGTMVPAAIIDNEENPDTSDKNYISIYLSLIAAIVLIGAVTIIATKKSRKSL